MTRFSYEDGHALGTRCMAYEMADDARGRLIQQGKERLRMLNRTSAPAFSSERAYWRGVLDAMAPREGGW